MTTTMKAQTDRCNGKVDENKVAPHATDKIQMTAIWHDGTEQSN